MTPDRIELRGLRVFAHHGVFDFEAEQGQTFVIDVVLHADLARAGSSDELSDTVHYGELAERISAVVTGERHKLIERVAQRVADVALSFEGVERAEVAIHKPEAPIDLSFDDVIVRIDRRA